MDGQKKKTAAPLTQRKTIRDARPAERWVTSSPVFLTTGPPENWRRSANLRVSFRYVKLNQFDSGGGAGFPGDGVRGVSDGGINRSTSENKTGAEGIRRPFCRGGAGSGVLTPRDLTACYGK